MMEYVSVIRIGKDGYNNIVKALASDGYYVKVMLDKKCIMINRVGRVWYKCFVIGK
jgi:hypothetical protein|nr:MAG TPA: hypothetical protein [Caudoviricetes sp.]